MKGFTPEYWQAYNERLATEMAQARAAGVAIVYQIQTSNDGGCPAAELTAAEGTEFGHNNPPALPLPGCARGLNCNCAFSAKMLDDEPALDPVEVDRRYEAAVASLPPRQASAIRRVIDGMLRSFGVLP